MKKGVLEMAYVGSFEIIAVVLIVVAVISFIYIDKKKADRFQRVTKAHYESLVEHNPNIVLTVDNNGLITNVNPKGIEISKFTREELLSSSFFSFFREEDLQMIEYKFHHLQEEQKNFEAPIKNGEGHWIPMVITFVPIIVDEIIVGVFVVARDNTELVESKERIKKAQKDLFNTIKRQQGMTTKFIKVGERYIHTLCEGELVYKLGCTPSLVVGKDLRDFLTEEVAEINLWAYEKAWKGEIVSYDGRLNGVDYYATLSPIIENGKVVEVIGSTVDISSLKNAEQYHKKKEKWYRSILSEMTEGVMLYSSNHEITPLNDNVHKMFGVTKEELQEQTIYDNIIDFIWEDGTPLELHKYPIYNTLETGATVTGEIIGIKHKEHITWLTMSSKLIEVIENEEETKVLFTMSDITQQKEQEIKLRESHALNLTLIDILPLGMLVVDNDLNIVAINQPFCSMFNLEGSLRDFIGKRIEAYKDKIFKNIEGELKRVMSIFSNKQPSIDEFELPNKRVIESRYFPFIMDDELKGHLWLFEDITERKQMERGMIKAIEEAENANMTKSEFLSKMSHELRTPLNGILGFSQLLELDHTLLDQQKHFVQEILNGGRHLLNLINEILDLSRIETGKIKISHEAIELGTIMKECINLIGSTANQNEILISNNLDQCKNNIIVYADQVRLRQVILNLLDNGIKYNREKGNINITCEVKNHTAIVHFIDNGIGISIEEQQQIFKPFYRREHPHIEGTGIGLSLVEQLIGIMGGEVGVESSEGKGSDFWFSLPIVRSETVIKGPFINNITRISPLNKKYKVLYIEDNLANLQLVTEILGTLDDISLLSTLRGDEGIQAAIEQKPDLILLDLHLPGMHGFDVFERLKSDPITAEIPIIALSANAMKDDIEFALNKGFVEYITKPIEIPSFIKLISTYLASSE